MHAVFDTNVVVAGMLSPDGPPGRIVDWLTTGEVKAVFDDRIISEYDRVLHYPRLKLPPADVVVLITRLIRTGLLVTVPPQHRGIELPHADDLPFAQCALTSQVPLVTGNRRHFPPAILHPLPVLTPAEFVQLCERSFTDIR